MWYITRRRVRVYAVTNANDNQRGTMSAADEVFVGSRVRYDPGSVLMRFSGQMGTVIDTGPPWARTLLTTVLFPGGTARVLTKNLVVVFSPDDRVKLQGDAAEYKTYRGTVLEDEDPAGRVLVRWDHSAIALSYAATVLRHVDNSVGIAMAGAAFADSC